MTKQIWDKESQKEYRKLLKEYKRFCRGII